MAQKISPIPAVFSGGSPSEIAMAQRQSGLENAGTLEESTGNKLLENLKESVAVRNFRIPEPSNPDMRRLEPTSEEEKEEKEPEIEYAEHIDELALGMDRNSLNGLLKDTDYPEGTFDQPITEKPKRFGSDSGKQKRKHLVIIKGKDSARGSEGEITEESLEEDFKESLLKHMLEYNACFAKIPVSDNHGDEVVVLKILPDPDMLEEEEVVFEILSNYDTSTVESETEDAESLYSLEDEMGPEDSIKDEYYIDGDSDDVAYNDRPRTIAPYIEDAPFVVADSGEYNEGACVADLPMTASGDCQGRTLGGDVGERGACLRA